MNQIINTIKTPQQLDNFTNLLDALSASIFKNNDAFEKLLQKDKSKTAQLLVSELSKPEVINDVQEKQKLLENLGAQLATLKTIHVTIAIPVTDETITLISTWSEKKLKGNYLFDIEYDPKIIGGAQISYEGKYMDDSLIRRLDNLFATRENEILELINE